MLATGLLRRDPGFATEPAQDFLSAHAFIHGHFHPRRHLMAATAYRAVRSTAFNVWQQETCAQHPP
jgi:putative transposase